MALSIEKRGNSRIHTRFEATFHAEERQGIGVLTDLSLTGARIRHCTFTPGIGARVALQVQIEDDRELLALDGAVLRHAEGGFVVAFEKVQEDLQRALDALEISLEHFIDPELLAEDVPEVGNRAAGLPLDHYTEAELETLAARVEQLLERRRA